MNWTWLCFFKHKWVYTKYPDGRFRECSRCHLRQEGFKIRNHTAWWMIDKGVK